MEAPENKAAMLKIRTPWTKQHELFLEMCLEHARHVPSKHNTSEHAWDQLYVGHMPAHARHTMPRIHLVHAKYTI